MTLVFESLRIENIRSYDEETIEFAGGENLIFGSNGAGKSTILQGLFGGLFQTAIKYQVGTEFDLADLVRKQADEGCIALTFAVGGEEYTVEWQIQKTYDEEGNVDGAKTKHGYPRLSSAALDEDISQVGNVRTEIRRLLGMDAQSFVNSVYVQQGDITRLIHADTETRREILDGLLGLHHLDDLVDRMHAVRLEYGKAARDAKAKRTEARNRLDELPEREELQAAIGETAEEIDDAKATIAECEEQLEAGREAHAEAKDALDRIGDLEAELADKRDSLSDAEDTHERHKTTLQDELDEKHELEDTLDDERDALGELRDHDALAEFDLSTPVTVTDAHETSQDTAESARSAVQSIEEGTLSTLDTELDYLNEEITDLETDIEDAEDTLECTIETRSAAESRETTARERVAELDADLTERTEEIADRAAGLDLPREASLDALARSHVPEKHRTLADEREAVREERGRLDTLDEQVDTLAAEGTCPVCGATEAAHDLDAEAVAKEHAKKLVTANDRLDDLDDQQERLDDLEERVHAAIDLRDDLEDARATVADVEDDLEVVEADIEKEETALDSLREERSTATNERERKRDQRADARADLEAATERVEQAETIERLLRRANSLYDEIDDHERLLAQHEQNIENVRELRQQAHERVRDLESDIEALEAELGDHDPDELRAEIEDIEAYIEEYEAEKATAEERVEELTGRIAELNQTKGRIRDEAEREAMLDEQVTWADERHDEAEAVIEAYKTVRGKLRKRNLAKLNTYTNEMFADLYQSQSYRGVQIDRHYDIHLVAADGQLIEPELSSGGESTILNLALRAGVYRIIAERDGVAGSALPPFILDEPTTYLDEDHVGELRTMIKTISEWDVPQVIVVSHDETLIENSDHAILVEKEPATETSRVRMGHASTPPPADGEAEAADD